jgi:hypothetical protein
VAAAQPGDTIRLVPQACNPFSGYYTAAVITQGLRIIGGGGSVNIATPLVFRNVPSTQAVIVENLRLSQGPSGLDTGIIVENCQGPVHWEAVETGDGVLYNSMSTHFQFTDCPDVTLLNCHLLGQVGRTVLTRCNAVVTDSSFSSGRQDIAGATMARSPSLEVIQGRASLVRCQVAGWGGQGNTGTFCSTPGWMGTPGLVVTNAVVRIGPGTTITGGTYSEYFPCAYTSITYCQYYSIQATSSQVTVDPSVIQTCPQSFPSRVMHVVASPAITAGVSTSATVGAAPGSLVLLAAGFAHQPGVSLPFGEWCLDVGAIAVIGLLTAGSTPAAFVFTVDLPPGTLVGLQAAVLLPDGSLSLSTPARMSVR